MVDFNKYLKKNSADLEISKEQIQESVDEVSSTEVVSVAPTIELNEDFKTAIHYLEETDESIFITGRAGSGKSTLIHYWKSITKKDYVVLAPTGIAAVNIEGQTLHSFFKLPFGIMDKDAISDMLYKGSANSDLHSLETIIIDEISMVRADILDAIEAICRARGKNKSKPFGGIQMVFMGDLYQLPPVVTNNDKEYFYRLYDNPFFFGAHVFGSFSFATIELKKVYRQKGDMHFLNILEAVRNNNISKMQLKDLNAKYNPFIEDEEDFCITLTTTNAKAKEINEANLNRLDTRKFTCFATVSGIFPQDSFPTDEMLVLKADAQIVMLRNDTAGRWYNGTLGKVIDFVDEKIVVQIKNMGGELQTYHVEKAVWENGKYEKDSSTGRMKRKIIGTFKQYPVKLAFAITGHKSQGQTYDKVRLHFGGGCFASGQAYVMLSRCRTLDGIRLLTELRSRDIILDREIVKFVESVRDKER